MEPIDVVCEALGSRRPRKRPTPRPPLKIVIPFRTLAGAPDGNGDDGGETGNGQ